MSAPVTCSEGSCTRTKNLVRGLCKTHYSYHRYHGTLPPKAPRPTPEERFWAIVDKTPTCWLWTGSLNPNGYGQFYLGHTRTAHRIAYQWLVGPVRDGLELDHLCRVTACVNPAHLEPVTHRENTLRGISPAARQAAQTHCKNGHEFTPENTSTSGGKRRCRICNRAWDRARIRNRRAA